MPTFYNFRENGLDYSFDDIFVPADLFREGNLQTWGYGSSGRLGNAVTTGSRSTPITTFAGGSNWKQVSATDFHTAAIKTDGTLWTWGSATNAKLGNAVTTGNISTPITTFAGGTNWKQVSAGVDFMAAIKTDGTLWTWGSASQGRLGNGVTTGSRSTPVTTFAGGTNWKQVSAGNAHTAAIKTDGTLWTWGLATSGILGNGVITGNISTPVTTFAGGSNWKQVSAANGRDSHTAAIKTDGTLWTWGLGTNGRLGNGLTIGVFISTPITTFTGGSNWKQVSGFNTNTAAIKTDGTLWTWGSGSSGALGVPYYDYSTLTPITTFAGGTNWADVASADPEELYTLDAGLQHTAAVKTDGTLWTWGYSNNGALGNGQTSNLLSAATPITTFTGGTNWKQVSAGNQFTSAIKTDGTLWTWGSATNGRLGNGVITGSRSTPVTTFAGGTNWKQVSAANQHTSAIKTDGTLWVWGSAFNGRLGNAVTTGNISTPVTTFAGGTNWKQVSAGNQHTSAIKTDGTLWTWGSTSNGKLGNGVVLGNISTPVTAFAGGTNWKQVSSVNAHTAAIKTDGTLWTWGSASQGILGNAAASGFISTPITTFAGGTDWKQVSTGGALTAAIKTDGTLWTWGYRRFGLGNNEAESNFASNVSTPITTFAGGTNWTQVNASDSTAGFVFALKDTGGNKEIYGFGYNGRYQLGNLIGSSNDIPNQTFQQTRDWKQVSAGNQFTAAIKTDGTLWIWGSTTNGKLGNGVVLGSIYTPVTTFAGGSNWKQVSSGSAHAAAVTYIDSVI